MTRLLGWTASTAEPTHNHRCSEEPTCCSDFHSWGPYPGDPVLPTLWPIFKRPSPRTSPRGSESSPRTGQFWIGQNTAASVLLCSVCLRGKKNRVKNGFRAVLLSLYVWTLVTFLSGGWRLVAELAFKMSLILTYPEQRIGSSVGPRWQSGMCCTLSGVGLHLPGVLLRKNRSELALTSLSFRLTSKLTETDVHNFRVWPSEQKLDSFNKIYFSTNVRRIKRTKAGKIN